jgi:hypothetical protein
MIWQFFQQRAKINSLRAGRNVEMLGQLIFNILDRSPRAYRQRTLPPVGVVYVLDEYLEVDGGVAPGKAIVMTHDVK